MKSSTYALRRDREPSQTYTCLAITRCRGPKRFAFLFSDYFKILSDKKESAGQEALGVNHMRNTPTIVVFLVLSWACFHQPQSDLCPTACLPSTPAFPLTACFSRWKEPHRATQHFSDPALCSDHMTRVELTQSHDLPTTELLFQATRTSGKDTTPCLCPAL